MPKRLFSLIDEDGFVLLHWRTDEASARHYATLPGNGLGLAEALVGPTGLIVATRAELLAR